MIAHVLSALFSKSEAFEPELLSLVQSPSLRRLAATNVGLALLAPYLESLRVHEVILITPPLKHFGKIQEY